MTGGEKTIRERRGERQYIFFSLLYSELWRLLGVGHCALGYCGCVVVLSIWKEVIKLRLFFAVHTAGE